MYDFTIGTITMNAGEDIPGSILKFNLNNQFKLFKRIIVVDGNLTEQAKQFYSKFPNVEYVDSPWTGNERAYRNQYDKIWEMIENNNWFGFLDDDEMWSSELIEEFLSKKIDDIKFKFDENCLKKGSDIDLICVPCILHLTEDGQQYFPAEPKPKNFFNGQWTKQIIVRKSDRIKIAHIGSHVQFKLVDNFNRIAYVPEPYYHMKSLESFVYNDVWQAFLSPEGQGYSEVESKKFKMFTSCYSSTKEFKQATKNGEWSPMLKKFAWDYRKQYTRAISRLAWTYFVLEGHEMPEADEFMTWDNMKQYVLSPETMAIYSENKKNNIGIKINEE